jgi:hypothetical protein
MKAFRFGLTLGLVVLSGAVLAMPSFLVTFKSTYKVPKDSALDKASCAACHIGKSIKLNPYGLDLKKVLQDTKTMKMTAEILKKVEDMDSDKDGVKNGEEIKKGTLPGDPKSK